MKNVFITILFCFCAFGWSYIENLGGGLDESRDVDVCADGGFFITGRSNAWARGGFAFNWYDYEAFLIKLDEWGNPEWIGHYGQVGYFNTGTSIAGYYDAGWSCIATADSGCIIAGKTQSPLYTDPFTGWPEDCIGNDNLLLVKVDKWGYEQWSYGYGGYYFDRGWCIEKIPGVDEYYIVGQTYTYGPGAPSASQGNIWIIRIDGAGNILAQRGWGILGSAGPSDARWCCVSPDGDCIIAGNTNDHIDSTLSPPRRVCKAVVIKANRDCEVVWSKIYDKGFFHYSRAICPAWGGGYMLQTYDSLDNRTWILYLDENGDTIWTKYVGFDSTGTRVAGFTMIVQAPRGGYYLAGSGFGMGYILHTDNEMNEIWHITYDATPETENFLSCVATPDGGCFAAGLTNAGSTTTYSDIFAARCNRFGEDYTTIAEKPTAKTGEISLDIYPNPFNSSVCISIPNVETRHALSPAKIEIFDINGRRVQGFEDSRVQGKMEFIWRPDEKLGSGIYLVRAKIGEKTSEKQVVYVK